MSFIKFISFSALIFLLTISLQAQQSGQSYNSLADRNQLELEDVVARQENRVGQIVSASRTLKEEGDLPFTVYTISREEIQKNGYITLVDALKSLPGIRVSQPGSGEDGETFLMRGLIGNYYTKILINNIPIQPTVIAGFPISAQLPIRQAERIEVIYGPAAAVYGADATTGVINIITNDPETHAYASGDVMIGEYGFKYLNFMAGGKAGRNNNILEYTIYGSNHSRDDLNIYDDLSVFDPLTYFSGIGEYINLEGEKISPETIDEGDLLSWGIDPGEFMTNNYQPNYEGSLKVPELSRLPQSSHMLGVELKFKGISFSFHDMYRSDHSSIGRNSTLFKFNNPNNYSAENIKRVSLSFNTTLNRFQTTTNLSYLRYRADNHSSIGRTYGNSNQPVYTYSASDDLFFEQLFFYQPDAKLEVLAGLSYQHSGNFPRTNDLDEPIPQGWYQPFSKKIPYFDPRFGSFGFNPLVFNNYAAFLQTYYIIDGLTLVGGIRHDYNTQYKGSTNPRLAALVTLSNSSSLRASLGSAFRAPSASLAYQSVAFEHDQGAYDYAVLPNKNLRPEKLESYELGYRKEFNQTIHLDLSVYYNRIENLISSTFVAVNKREYPRATNDSARTNLNSSSARSKLVGIQASIQWENLIEAIKLNSEINLNYAIGQEVLPTDGFKINDFRMLPKFMGQLNLDLEPFNDFSLRVENVFMGSWLRRYLPNGAAYSNDFFKIDGYYTMDLMGRYELSENFRVFGRVINVFDANYGGIEATGLDIDMRFNPQLGRNIQVGLNVRFD